MNVYVVKANDSVECVLADKEAAEEYVAYEKDREKERQRKRRQVPIFWRYYEFPLIYGQYR